MRATSQTQDHEAVRQKMGHPFGEDTGLPLASSERRAPERLDWCRQVTEKGSREEYTHKLSESSKYTYPEKYQGKYSYPKYQGKYTYPSVSILALTE